MNIFDSVSLDLIRSPRRCHKNPAFFPSTTTTKLLDNYVATWSVLIICVIECLAVSYIYGVGRFLADIQAMVGYRPWPIWAACWACLTPAILLIIIVLTFLNYEG